MNHNRLIDLHLHAYQVANDLDPQTTFGHLRSQISRGHDLRSRKTMEGHVTSSMMLLNPQATQALMIYHIFLGLWLFPGGHWDNAHTPRANALDELEQETGFPASRVTYLDHRDYVALDLDTHAIPSNPAKDEGAHWHHDFLYLGIALEDHALKPQLEEVDAVKWMDLSAIAQSSDARVARAAGRVLDRLAMVR